MARSRLVLICTKLHAHQNPHLRDLVNMLDDFHQRGIHFRSLTEEINTSHRAAS
jgi:DNA invertase Pin-like site-specific DNA recombinase